MDEGEKGQGVIGVGRLVNESWEDSSGTKRYGTKVELERAHFVSSGTKAKVTPTPKPRANESAPTPPLDEEFPPEDNLPF